MRTLQAFVEGIGVAGPGLESWPTASSILRGEAPYAPAETLLPPPDLLAPAERRRASRVVRVALAASVEATRGREDERAGFATVFASSGGDGENCHQICTALAVEAREVSPTRFMHSVHNAPAGYWSIAARAMGASTALCAHDGSFAAGLLEALCQLDHGTPRVLITAYDIDYPEPLRSQRPIAAPFAMALLLAYEPAPRGARRIEVDASDRPCSALAEPQLERLRRGIPAARGLPLLQLLAADGAGSCVLEHLGPRALAVRVDRCEPVQ